MDDGAAMVFKGSNLKLSLFLPSYANRARDSHGPGRGHPRAWGAWLREGPTEFLRARLRRHGQLSRLLFGEADSHGATCLS